MAEKLKMWWLVWFGLMIFMTRYCKLVGLKLIENQFVFLATQKRFSSSSAPMKMDKVLVNAVTQIEVTVYKYYFGRCRKG